MGVTSMGAAEPTRARFRLATPTSALALAVLAFALALAFAAVGYVVARQQPRNPIGWIFLSLGLMTLTDYVVRLSSSSITGSMEVICRSGPRA